MNTRTFPDPSKRENAVVAVDAAVMRDLADNYTLYEQALGELGDPVRVLNMAGDVLAAVRRVLTDAGRGRR
ncbi:hypothetical protein [Arthrobacter sp. MMS24-S77]